MSTGLSRFESKTRNFCGLRFSFRPPSMMWPISEGRLSTGYFAGREAGRGELLGFQGVSEADRGIHPRHSTHSSLCHYAAVSWLQNQATLHSASVSHGSVPWKCSSVLPRMQNGVTLWQHAPAIEHPQESPW